MSGVKRLDHQAVAQLQSHRLDSSIVPNPECITKGTETMSYHFTNEEHFSATGSFPSNVRGGLRHRRSVAPETNGAGRHWSSGATSTAVAIEFPELLQAAQLGDDRAFSSLVSHYRQFADRVATQILRTEEAAADAVQEAMIKVHRALPRFQEGNFRSWLLRIVTNTCYDHLRRQKRRRAVSLDELAEGNEAETALGLRATDEIENPETVALQRESMHLLMSAIDELPLWHRNVILLIDVHGFDYEEAAVQLGVPLGTVKSRLNRGRIALRDRLVRDGLVPAHLLAV